MNEAPVTTRDVVVYSADWCAYCDRAKSLLQTRKIEFDEINVDRIDGFRERLFELTGRNTVPQVFIKGEPVGGFQELRALDQRGGLAALAG